jgi:hypothetical protein
MKKNHRLFIALFLFVFVLSACTATPTPTPGASVLPPLPTPDVPSVSIVDDATQRWETSNNMGYYLEVTEKTRSAERLFRIVVKDGEVRAAQVLDKTETGWSEPVALPLNEAENYTVDALLARLRRDVTGGGSAPLNVKVVFNQSTGVPEVVNAEALPSYSETGTMQLNREFSYSLVTRIRALIEETAKPGEEPFFVLTRSNGPEAWCESLLIYADASSQHSNDCIQTSLPLTVSTNLMSQLEDLTARFDQLDVLRQSGDQIEHLVISGNGSTAPTPQIIQEAWDLADQLNVLLSYPLGAGVILLYTQGDDILGMDMQLQSIQPALIAINGNLRGVSIDLSAEWLVFGDDVGVRIQEIATGSIQSVLAQPSDESYYLPGKWNVKDEFLVTLVPEAGGTYQHGVVRLEDKSISTLPLPEGLESYGCDTGTSWSPDGSQLVIAGLGSGEDCNTSPGLTVADLVSGETQVIVTRLITNETSDGAEIIAGTRNPAWSPNGEWIAFSMDEDASTSRLYLVHPDGRSLAPISNNTRGQADNPVWTPEGMLYYSLVGANTNENGIYQYNLETGESVLFLPGENLHTVTISPDGEFLVYFNEDILTIYVFLTEENLPDVIKPVDGELPIFSGWIAPPEE